MTNFILAAEATPSWLLPVLLLGLLVVMLVLPTLSNKKRMKQFKEMQDGLKVGDKVQTIGGIIGRINRINDKDGVKSVVLETGDKKEKTFIEFDVNAIAGPIIKVPAAEPNLPETELEKKDVEPAKDEILEQIEKNASAKTAGNKKKSKKSN